MAELRNELQWEGFQLFRHSRRLKFMGSEIPLTRAQFEIFSLLLSNPEQVFSRAQLLVALGIDSQFRAESIVDSHIARIRKVVQTHGGPRVIQAIHGIGFRLEK